MPPLSVTVNTASSPSSTLASSALTTAITGSSSSIVPSALDVPSLTPAGKLTSVSSTVNVSAASFRSSSVVATVTVFSVCPPVNVSVVADTPV